MVKGLERFREHFEQFSDYYVIIGGTACDMLFDEAGVPFPRSTKDLDIVLLLQTGYSDFIRSLWEFIKDGEYNIREHHKVKCNKYRFSKPGISGFPDQLELFSTDVLEQSGESQDIIRVVTEEDVSDISAIILEPAYYELIQQGKLMVTGISILDAPYIIPLKARAWMDLKKKREAGEKVDSNDVKKHLNDVIRLAQLLVPGNQISLKGMVKQDFISFLEAFKEFEMPGFRDLRVSFQDKSEVLELLAAVFV